MFYSKDKNYELDNENSTLNDEEEHNQKSKKKNSINRYSFDKSIKDDNNFYRMNTNNIANTNKK